MLLQRPRQIPLLNFYVWDLLIKRKQIDQMPKKKPMANPTMSWAKVPS